MHAADGWEQLRSHIQRLYIEQRRPLKDVRTLLARHYGFKASERMYKTKIMQWGFRKNCKSSELGSIIQEVDHTKRHNLIEAPVSSNEDLVQRMVSQSPLKKNTGQVRSSESGSEAGPSPHLSWFTPPLCTGRALLSESIVRQSRQDDDCADHAAGRSHRYHSETPTSDMPSPASASKYSSSKRDSEALFDDVAASSCDEHPPKRSRSSCRRLPSQVYFACPFYKQDPVAYNPQNPSGKGARFRSCAGPGWNTIHRLREHLHRAHTLECSCLRSGLRETMRGWTDEEKWRKIYFVLFPTGLWSHFDARIPSPYYSGDSRASPPLSVQSEHAIEAFAAHLRSELSSQICQELTQPGASGHKTPAEQLLLQRVTSVLHSCLDQAVRDSLSKTRDAWRSTVPKPHCRPHPDPEARWWDEPISAITSIAPSPPGLDSSSTTLNGTEAYQPSGSSALDWSVIDFDDFKFGSTIDPACLIYHYHVS